MKSYRLFVVLMASLVLGMFSSAFGQSVDKITKFLSKLQVGEWVEFEGVPQKDFSILVEEIEAIYGEMEDDDWEISGMISSLYPDKKMGYLLNLPLLFDEKVEYDDDFGKLKSFSDLKTGMYIELEGTLMHDGKFQVTEVGQMDPKDVELNRVEWTGKVQNVDVNSMTITVLGHTIQLTKGTQVKSPVTD